MNSQDKQGYGVSCPYILNIDVPRYMLYKQRAIKH